MFYLAKVPVTFFESHSYLKGVAAAQLKYERDLHFANMHFGDAEKFGK